jgi:hypothetical protein
MHSCKHLYCTSRFFSKSDIDSHESIPHTPAHHPVWDDSTITCAECNETFDSAYELLEHADNRQHSPYACSCGVKFVRNDALKRHIASYLKENAKYACTFCRRHRGKHAFRRKDHLVQHLRGYHKMEREEISNVLPLGAQGTNWGLEALICPHADCEAYRDNVFKSLPRKEKLERMPFQKRSDYYKHMRDIHKESMFPCHVANCDRVGVKGYLRAKDFMKHIANKHPEVPQHVLSKTVDTIQCPLCGKKFSSYYTLLYHQEFERPCQKH